MKPDNNEVDIIEDVIAHMQNELEKTKQRIAIERCPLQPGTKVRHKKTQAVYWFDVPGFLREEPGYFLRLKRINKTTGLPSTRSKNSYTPEDYEQV